MVKTLLVNILIVSILFIFITFAAEPEHVCNLQMIKLERMNKEKGLCWVEQPNTHGKELIEITNMMR